MKRRAIIAEQGLFTYIIAEIHPDHVMIERRSTLFGHRANMRMFRDHMVPEPNWHKTPANWVIGARNLHE